MATWFLRTPSLQAPTSRLNTSSSKPRKQLTRVFLRQREKLPNRSRIHTPCYSPTHFSHRLLKLKPFAAHGETTETDEKEVIEVEEESQTLQAPLPQQPLKLEIGKSFDILDLLSSRSSGRYYLVRNNGDKVPIESLIGKTIGIYGLPLEVGEKERIYSGTEDLIECYNEYNPSGKFEVVLVAAIDQNGDFDATKDRQMFQNCFSKMPWLAIPCQDIDSRKRLAKSNFTMFRPTCAILDPVGRAIRCDALGDLYYYGTDCFPFTAERFKELKRF